MHHAPPDIAALYPEIGQRKAATPFVALLFRAILAGAYVGMACFGAHSVACLIADARIASLVSALLFPTGLAMVILVGGELFTGNHLMALSVMKKRISPRAMLGSWGVVFLGNLIGAVLIAALAVAARQSDDIFREVAIRVAQAKATQSMGEAFLRAVLCNFFVCTAVWMSYSTQSTPGKIIAIYFPVMMFVLCGTEHCVANIYYQIAGLLFGAGEAWPVLANLIPATLGNIAGGLCVCGALWFSYLR